MIAPLKPGVTLAQPNGPVIETERLILRQWRGADIGPNTAMLADPGTARFITADGKPVTEPLVGWRNAARPTPMPSRRRGSSVPRSTTPTSSLILSLPVPARLPFSRR